MAFQFVCQVARPFSRSHKRSCFGSACIFGSGWQAKSVASAALLRSISNSREGLLVHRFCLCAVCGSALLVAISVLCPVGCSCYSMVCWHFLSAPKDPFGHSSCCLVSSTYSKIDTDLYNIAMKVEPTVNGFGRCSIASGSVCIYLRLLCLLLARDPRTGSCIPVQTLEVNRPVFCLLASQDPTLTILK